MSESRKHQDGVEALRRIVVARYAGRRDLVLSVDTPDADHDAKPPRVGGFRPDVYAKTWLDGQFLIGEAKTARDLETKRSVAQISAFLLETRFSVRGFFVLAVPFAVETEGVALLNHLGAGDLLACGRVRCVAIEEQLVGTCIEVKK